MTKSAAASPAILAALALAAAPAGAQDHGAAAALATPPVTAATARAQTPLGAAFDAADRGELAPLRQLAASARGELALLVRTRLTLARFEGLADLPALARIAGSRDAALREAALSLLSADAFLRGAYADAARWGRAYGEAQAARGDAAGAARTAQQAQVAALLAGHAAQSLEGAVAERSIPAHTDRVGLPRIDIAVNGQAQEAVFDTGASLSVLSTATARRLGVTIIEGGASVGNGVEGNVAVRLGIVDRLEIAGAVLRNVPFLIIDDAQLTFPVPGGYDIRAIVGLPVMHALGRMRIEPAAGRFTLLPAVAAPAGPPNLVATAGQVFVKVAVDGREVPLHLDTGANQSALSARYAAANPARVAALATGQARMASAGGTASTRFATWRDPPLALAGRALPLLSLRIGLAAPGAPEPRDNGTLGSDALRAFESYTLDFRAMRLEVGPAVPAPAPAAAH
ncbi:MAG: retropepsin-like domain-containing protein [Sphingomonadaceae bacterium]|nr:retropepsin-like domain-containing protein [Sphingomonadaceae bacterium]